MEEAFYYVQNTLEHGWSRSVLTHQIENGLWQREGKAYALSDINKPIGVSEYQLTQSLPKNLKPNLPSVEEIEAELADELGVRDE